MPMQCMQRNSAHPTQYFLHSKSNSRFTGRGEYAHVRQNKALLFIDDKVLKGIGDAVHGVLIRGGSEDVAGVLDALGPVGAGTDREADGGSGTAMDDAIVGFGGVGVDAFPRGRRRWWGWSGRVEVLGGGKTAGTSTEEGRGGQNQFAAHFYNC